MTEFLERKKEWVFFGALLVLGILVYSNTWNVPFQFDDHRMIEKNLSIRNGVNIPRIWAENSKARFVPVVSFALSYSLGGEQPFGYHLFNVGLHLCNALWVYFLLSLILASPRMRGIYSPKAAFYLAAFGALIFVVHPLQTQAVTYIVQRIAALAAFFYLGAIVLYLKARSGSGAWYYAGAVGMAAAAICAPVSRAESSSGAVGPRPAGPASPSSSSPRLRPMCSCAPPRRTPSAPTSSPATPTRRGSTLPC